MIGWCNLRVSRQKRKLQLLDSHEESLLLLLLPLHPPTHLPFLHLQCSKTQLDPLVVHLVHLLQHSHLGLIFKMLPFLGGQN